MKSSCLGSAYFTSGRAVGLNTCCVVLDPLGSLRSMLNTIYIFLLFPLMTHWLLSMYIIPFSSPFDYKWVCLANDLWWPLSSPFWALKLNSCSKICKRYCGVSLKSFACPWMNMCEGKVTQRARSVIASRDQATETLCESKPPKS